MIATINVISVGCMYTMNLCLFCFFFSMDCSLFFSATVEYSQMWIRIDKKSNHSLHFSTEQTTKKDNNNIVAVFWFLYNKSFGMTIEKKGIWTTSIQSDNIFLFLLFHCNISLIHGVIHHIFFFVCYEFSF